jgi:hypothetical protein
MRRIRDILRMCWELKLGQTRVAESLGISSSTVNRLIHSALAAVLSWPLPPEMDDTTLEHLLYPSPEERPSTHPEPDWQYTHDQLKSKGATVVLLWQEYKEQPRMADSLASFTSATGAGEHN